MRPRPVHVACSPPAGRILAVELAHVGHHAGFLAGGPAVAAPARAAPTMAVTKGSRRPCSRICRPARCVGRNIGNTLAVGSAGRSKTIGAVLARLRHSHLPSCRRRQLVARGPALTATRLVDARCPQGERRQQRLADPPGARGPASFRAPRHGTGLLEWTGLAEGWHTGRIRRSPSARGTTRRHTSRQRDDAKRASLAWPRSASVRQCELRRTRPS